MPADKKLVELLKDNDVSDQWIQILTDESTPGTLRTLRDLINLPDDPASPAADLREYMEAFKVVGFDPKSVEGRTEIGRFKAAFKKAHGDAASEAVTAEEEMDLEKPLKKGDIVKMRDTFEGLYSIEIQSRINPSATLITIFYRMMMTMQCTL